MAHQDELPLSSVLSHAVFPGRTVLYPFEVARALHLHPRHVIDLCNEGTIVAIDVSGENNKSDRKEWRIPVSSYDEYVTKKSKHR